jgi:hypothetical protein
MALLNSKKAQIPADTSHIQQMLLVFISVFILFSLCMVVLTNLQDGIVSSTEQQQYTDRGVVLNGGIVTLSRGQCTAINSVVASP